MKKELGKITNVFFGLGGYQDAEIGIHFTFGGESWGVSSGTHFWDVNLIKYTVSTKWTEKDRSDANDKIIRYISGILKDAKVKKVSDLLGIPVSVTFEDNTIKDWRILKEVL